MSPTVVRSMLASIVLSAIGVAWIVVSVGEPSDLLVALDLPLLHAVLAVVAVGTAFTLGGARLSFICRRVDVRLAVHHGVRTHLLGTFSAAVTPGGAGNTPAIALMLQHHGAPSGAAWAVAVAVFRADAVFHAWGLPVALAALFALGTIPASVTWWAIGVFAIVATASFAWIMQFKLHWLRPIAERLLRGPLLRFRRAGLRFVDGMLASNRLFAEAPASWQLAVQGMTTASWLAYFSVLYVLAHGLAVPVSLVEAVAMQLVVVTTSTVVPTPGGSGFFELGISYLLLAQGGAQSVPAVVLMWRLVTFYSAFLLGPLLGGYVVAQRLQAREVDRATGAADDA